MTALMLAATLLAAEPTKKPTQHLTFDPDTIGGLRDGAQAEYVDARNPPKFGNLIKIRENFNDKIIRSVDQM